MEENLKSASEWQGTDKYAGIDSYEKVVLKAGTELCALVSYKDGEICPCAYLFPKNALEIVKDDDVLLNRMLPSNLSKNLRRMKTWRRKWAVRLPPCSAKMIPCRLNPLLLTLRQAKLPKALKSL